MTMNKGIYEKGASIKTFEVASGQTPALGDVVYISAEGKVSQAGALQLGTIGVVVDIPYRGEYTAFPGGTYKDPYTAAAGDNISVCVGGIVTCLSSGTPSIGDPVVTGASGSVTDVTLATDTAANLSAQILAIKGRFIVVDNDNNVAQIYLQQ